MCSTAGLNSWNFIYYSRNFLQISLNLRRPTAMGYVGGWTASERDAYSSLSAAKRYLGTTNPTTGQTEQVMCLFPLILNPPFTLLSAFAVAPHKWWFVSTYDLFVFSQTTSFFFGDYYYYYFKRNDSPCSQVGPPVSFIHHHLSLCWLAGPTTQQYSALLAV